MKCTRVTVQYPDGTTKTIETIEESPIEELGNAMSKTFDNGVRTLQGKPINNTPRLSGS